jgi:ABC-2 type transport system ATP-binding protein
MIQVEELTKRYPKVPVNAVDGVSFHVGRGEIFGLLGPNGAGKTTTVGMLTTLVRPTRGRIWVAGVDVVREPSAAKQHFSVIPQQSNLDRSLRPREILTFHAAYHGVPRAVREARARELLEAFGLAAKADAPAAWYSGGMSQRLMIARALMHDPAVIFMDEPTNRLDPQSRLFVWDRVRELRERGIAVLITTHDMDEAERLCDRVAIMDRGRILAHGSPSTIIREAEPGGALELAVRPPPTAAADWMPHTVARLHSLPGVRRVTDGNGARGRQDGAACSLRLEASDLASLTLPAMQIIREGGGEPIELRVRQPTLEDVFIRLTGRSLRS